MLDLRAVALQGLTVQLKPVVMAVQALIAEMEEDERRRREVLGGAGRRRTARSASRAPQKKRSDWDLRAAHHAEDDRLKRRVRNNMIVALVSAAVTEGML